MCSESHDQAQIDALRNIDISIRVSPVVPRWGAMSMPTERWRIVRCSLCQAVIKRELIER